MNKLTKTIKLLIGGRGDKNIPPTPKRDNFKTHVGELLLEEFIKPTGLSYNAIARELGISGTRISEIVKGHRSITVGTDLRLCKFFGVRDGYFLRAQTHLELIKAKRELQLELDKIKPFNEKGKQNVK